MLIAVVGGSSRRPQLWEELRPTCSVLAQTNQATALGSHRGFENISGMVSNSVPLLEALYLRRFVATVGQQQSYSVIECCNQ
jgi:hypothetical protein